MMRTTGPAHYRDADRLLHQAENERHPVTDQRAVRMLLAAIVHAVQANTAATIEIAHNAGQRTSSAWEGLVR